MKRRRPWTEERCAPSLSTSLYVLQKTRDTVVLLQLNSSASARAFHPFARSARHSARWDRVSFRSFSLLDDSGSALHGTGDAAK
jgi:hypothetical protein